MPRLLYFLILTLIIDNVSSEILNKNSCVWDNEYGISCVEIKLLHNTKIFKFWYQ